MKAFDIALKDLHRYLTAPFALIMMFGAPLLITGLLYFAFGGLADGGDLDLQTVRVQVANLDRPSAQSNGFAAGKMLVQFLQSEDLGNLVKATLAADEAAARAAVDARQADVALIIPPDFTAAVLAPQRQAAVLQYQDPTLTIGPAIVESLVSQFLDDLAGAKVTASVVSQQLQARGVASGAVAQEAAATAAVAYSTWLGSSGQDHEGAALTLQIRSPAAQEEAAGDEPGSMRAIMGNIMIAMTIFFAFFAGANSAESIVREDEAGTLQRMFTTPTSRPTILAGKLAFVILLLVVQVTTLLVASGLIFGIRWGQPASVVLATLGLVVVAAGFGVLLMSFVQNTRQTGPVTGGVLTVTGMLGGLFSSGMPDLPEVFDTIRLAMPQGWAMYTWERVLSGGRAEDVLLPVAVMLGLGLLLFSLGTVLFRRRFA